MEVCLDNQWGTICDDLWNSPDANVACRQLGFAGTGTVVHKNRYRIAGNFRGRKFFANARDRAFSRE